MKTKQLTDSIFWIGTQDPDLKIFDIVMHTEYGTSYNSYLVKGSEKTAIFETAKLDFFDEYIEKVKEKINIEDIDYIVLNHTEPDHSGSVVKLLKLNPKIKVVGSAAAINFTKEIVNDDFDAVKVKDGDVISLGDKTLKFISAPNLHWPDTMFTYIEEEKTLMTCDAFGAHFSHDGVTDDNITNQEGYMKALRYYYDCILSHFKEDYVHAIEKIQDLDIKIIGTGHGPVLVKNPKEIISLSKQWAMEKSPHDNKYVVIAYVSAYGYTKMLAEALKKGIEKSGDVSVLAVDVVNDEYENLEQELHHADGILLGTPTMVGEALKPVMDIASSFLEKIHGGKIASAFGSYGWSGEGVPHIIERLKQVKFKIYDEEGFKVRFKPSDGDLKRAEEFGFYFGKSVLAGDIVSTDELSTESVNSDSKEKVTKKWRCVVCNKVVEGENPPEECPVCHVGADKFEEIV